jgi:bifunctional UDP-N-acetylglucosamine pyrophosphorylase/glucosamine-1-phosphate N-acetyltransferase
VLPEDTLALNTAAAAGGGRLHHAGANPTHLRENGVTIVAPLTTYVESGVAIDVDTVVQPFTFIGGGTSIGRDCVIGPFATSREKHRP